MLSHLYRYRSAEKLLSPERQELAAQEIYFSPMEELNDPLEGFKDVVWQGDEIAWTNLLKHYQFSLLIVAEPCFKNDLETARHLMKAVVRRIPTAIPPSPLRTAYLRASGLFLDEPAVKRFIELLKTQTAPVRKAQLLHYLRALHGIALKALMAAFEEQGVWLVPNFTGSGFEELRNNSIRMLEAASALPTITGYSESAAEELFEGLETTEMQLQLISEIQNEALRGNPAMRFLSSQFPRRYISALDGLMYPEWYVACFSANPINSSMWATYGDNHRGVCLKFRTSTNANGAMALNLNRIVGMGGRSEYVRGFQPAEFRQVDYDPKPPVVDFFRSLGRVPQPHLNHFWYAGDNGTRSICRETLLADEDAWRQRYWASFGESSLYKTPDWRHEEEYRLVVHSNLGFLEEKPMRKLQYRFEDLTGIAFGVQTSDEHKHEIIQMIGRKCVEAKRANFEFYQVKHSARSSGLMMAPLSLIKIQP